MIRFLLALPAAAALCLAQTADFSLTADETNKAVSQGTDVSYTITETTSSGSPYLRVFNAPASFSFVVNGNDCGAAGSSIRFFPWNNCGVATSGVYTLTMNTTTLTPGVYNFAIVGTEPLAGNGFGLALTLTVTAAGAPDFVLSTDATTRAGAQATDIAFTVTQTALGGFTGATNLAVNNIPAGMNCSYPTSITGSGTALLTLHLGPTAPGTYTLSVSGASGALTHTASVIVTVNPAPAPTIYLTSSPAFQYEPVGTSVARYTLSAAPLAGYTGPVAFTTASGLDPGVSVSFSPSSANVTSGAVTTVATVSTIPSSTTGSHSIFFAANIGTGAAAATVIAPGATLVATTQSSLAGTNLSLTQNEGSGSTLVDTSPSGNNFSAANTAWAAQPGVSGLVTHFDGTAYADGSSAAATAFTGSTPFSFSTWRQFDRAGVQEAVASNLTGTTGWEVTKSSADAIEAALLVSYPFNSMVIDFPVSGFSTAKWYHIVTTFDGSRTAAGTKVYVNGVSLSGTVVTDTLSSSVASSTPLRLGARTNSTLWTVGNMADTRIFNRVLNASEVTALFNAGAQ